MNYDISIVDRISELGYDINEVTPEQEMYLRMAVRHLVDVALEQCKRLAQERLHSKKVDYVKALKMTPAGSDQYIIELAEDMVPYDEGFGPFDEKPGLLHGPNAKISKDGVPYNIVPIKGNTEYGGSAGKTEFRVVTGNSPRNSWIHPGYAGCQIFSDVFAYLDQEVDYIIQSTLGE